MRRGVPPRPARADRPDPEARKLDEALRAIDIAIDDQLPVLVLSFHSPRRSQRVTP